MMTIANVLSAPVPSPRGGGPVATVEVREFKEVNLKGGTVVAAFPSVGLVSTITATYLISTLKVDQVTALDSADFPSLSMVYAKKPKFPARVYASLNPKLAIFICEMPLPMATHRPVALALLRWATDHGCRQVVPLEGLPVDPDVPATGETSVWGVGSTDRARKELETRGIPQLETGMIAGVTGVLLNEGRWLNADVIALLAEARFGMPDARAAVSLVRTLDQLLPDIQIELGPLQDQAKALEDHLRRLKDQAKSIVPPEPVPSEMYR
jgi:uncharacterized protein